MNSYRRRAAVAGAIAHRILGSAVKRLTAFNVLLNELSTFKRSSLIKKLYAPRPLTEVISV
jgi:hypothetical protein